MKKLFLSSMVLFLFSLSIVVFDASCKKTAVAQTNNSVNTSQIGVVLVEGDSSSGPTLVHQYYTVNYDGTNLKQIPIPALSTGFSILDGGKLSPDGKTLFFIAINATGTITNGNYPTYLFSVNTDGTGLKQLAQIPAGSAGDAAVQGAY